MTLRDDDFGERPTTRPRYRPPTGMPLRRDDDYRVGALVAIGLHALAVLLILMPFVVATMIAAPPTGAGGAGPAGGGGGGTRGTGGSAGEYAPERLRYISIEPAPPPAALPAVEEAEPEPVPPTPPPPEEEEPEPTPPVSETPPAPTAEPLAGSADAQGAVPSPIPGSGGGTGDDGTTGTGPGSGGGIGSGAGTGTGSGDGPGTGGGTGDVYLPTATLQVFPSRKPRAEVPGDTIPVLFEIDETGRVLRIEFPPTRDRSYNKHLAEVLSNWKFRPATRRDGTPVRATYPLVIGPL